MTDVSELTIPIAVAAGLLSFASPCFLPVVPVFLAYLLGDEAAAPGTRVSRAQRVAAASQAGVFIAGFTAVFVALWASIGLLGYIVGDFRGVLRILGGAVLIVMGLHVAGLIEVGVLQREKKVSMASVVGMAASTSAGVRAQAGGGTATVVRDVAPAEPAHLRPSYRRSVLLGMAFAAGWSPCIGPILGGVIGLATVGDSVAQGVVLLLAYCVGLGLPFLAMAVGATEVGRHLGRLRNHQTLVSLVSGGFLIAIGFLMITDLMGRLTGMLPVPGL